MKRADNNKALGRRSEGYRSWNKENVRSQVNGRSKEQPFKSLQTYIEINHEFSLQ